MTRGLKVQGKKIIQAAALVCFDEFGDCVRDWKAMSVMVICNGFMIILGGSKSSAPAQKGC